jgi:predicted unusual protein kinase regulating ubiquinone biosynthesis (AarF/ABC1/UbiB family)
VRPRSFLIVALPAIVLAAALARIGSRVGRGSIRRDRPRPATSAVGTPVNSHRTWVRNLRLARLGLRSGRRYALHRARRTFASVERAEELDTEFQIRTAEEVTGELGNMKGAMMKIGQMASYLDTGLPDHVRQTMASLQHDAPPMAPELAAEQVRAELGAWPEDIFDQWDERPIASASIGQVHRAITREGRAVAVKIQYPGVAEAVAADLRNAGWIFSGLASLFPGVDPEPIVEEIRSRLLEELDYGIEAENQRLFHQYFAGHPYISVPGVVDELSTRRVLTTDLAVGSRFDEVVAWSEEERNLAAETLFRFSFGAIYRLHAFNGDPHPGNYLFRPGGQVTFLDFGLVKRFDPAETVLFEELIREMVVNRDRVAFRRVVESAGILAPDAPFDDGLVEDYFSYYYRYVMTDGPVTIDADYAAGGVQHLFDTSGPYGDLMKSLNVPPSFVVVQRITLGLMGLFAQLEATANWQRIAAELWPFTSSPPSTPMGEEIRAWRRANAHPVYGV